MLYYFLSYPNQRCRPPIIAISQVSCLERLQSQTHFLRFETKLSQVFFFFLKLFPELHITFQLYQGFCLLEDCVKLLFCVTTSFNMTRIHFSTKRPLVKILQRKLIGKCTIYYSLSERKKVKVKSSVVSDSLQPRGL